MNESEDRVNVFRLAKTLDQLSKNEETEHIVDVILLSRWLQINHPGSILNEAIRGPPEAVDCDRAKSKLEPDQPKPEVRKRQVSKGQPSDSAIEDEMLRMASEMKHVAGGVQTLIRRDVVALEQTSSLQEANIATTSVQISSADSIRNNKRLGFLFMIFMVLSSLAAFIGLCVLIVVIT